MFISLVYVVQVFSMMFCNEADLISAVASQIPLLEATGKCDCKDNIQLLY